MAIEIEIFAQACRGCELCVDVCPTKVFVMDGEKRICGVKEAKDCIGCLSCTYICPSGAITHSGLHAVKNFYRDETFCTRMKKFL